MGLDDRREREEQVADFLLEYAQHNRNLFRNLRNRRAATTAANNQIFLEELAKQTAPLQNLKLPPLKYSLKPDTRPKERIVNLCLSDLHYGALLDEREVPSDYGPVEEARRTAAVVLQAAEYKKQYRKESKLYIHLLGDIMQGQLHDARDGAPMAAQVAACQWYLIQVVRYLAGCYPEVEVFCTPGNHGRNKVRHQERAVVQKWDSLETTIYVALKHAVAHLTNVKIHIPYTPFYIAQAFDKKGFYTHGDTVLCVGFPSKGIDTNKARATINEFIVSGKHDADLFMTGHVHCGSTVHLSNGRLLMTNGCLIPSDHFAQSKGILSTKCVQWLWESTKGHIVGDQRLIEVDEYTDRDSSLSKIITPYTGL